MSSLTPLLQDACTRSLRYLGDIRDRTVRPAPGAFESVRAGLGELRNEPVDAAEVLRTLDELVAPATVANAGGRFFGFVNGGTLPAGLAASWMVSAWDQNAALQCMSPAAAALDEIAVRWTCELLGLPAGTGGGIVTGATMANVCGLAAARHGLLARHGWDVESQGLFGAPEIRVIVGEEVHTSLLKALALLGFGRDRVTRAATDSQGRMRADTLPPVDARTIVCLQAGNVNSGAFDRAREICVRSRAAGAWVHVDGAFGLWAAASPHYRHLTNGFEQADSWATDGHKWPNVGYDCGIALVRDPRHLRAAMTASAAYLQVTDTREPSHFTPELSRRARGIELWAVLRSLGRDGMAELVDRTCGLARRFASALAVEGYPILNDVVINQVLVGFGERTPEIVRQVQEDGVCWCGGTVWRGQPAMRISVCSWATTETDVDRSVEAICRVARRAGKETHAI